MPATQITSLQAIPSSGVPPFLVIFRGLLSVVEPFGGLPNKNVNLQIFSPQTSQWADVGGANGVGVTDANGVFNIGIVMDPAVMTAGTWRFRVRFAGDGTNTASVSQETTVSIGGGFNMIALVLGATALIGAFFIVRKMRH